MVPGGGPRTGTPVPRSSAGTVPLDPGDDERRGRPPRLSHPRPGGRHRRATGARARVGTQARPHRPVGIRTPRTVHSIPRPASAAMSPPTTSGTSAKPGARRAGTPVASGCSVTRLPADGGAEPRERRDAGEGRYDDHRPQDALGVRPLPHRGAGGSPGGGDAIAARSKHQSSQRDQINGAKFLVVTCTPSALGPHAAAARGRT